MRKSSLIWGSALLLLGLLMLADSAGLRLPGGIRPLSIFWPAVLMLAGAWLITSVFLRGELKTEQASIPLEGAVEASVRISHGAGELKVTGGAAPGLLAEGTFVGGLEHSEDRDGSRLKVKMEPEQSMMMAVPPFEPRNWDLRLSTDVPMSLKLKMGANKAVVDLRQLRLTALKVETGASESQITLPERGRLRADFSLGAASLKIRVPEGAAARIRSSSGISDVQVDESRFPRSGDHYQSADYDTAPNAIEITVEAGAAEVHVF